MKMRIAVETPRVRAKATLEVPSAVIPEAQAVAVREVPQLQEALVPVEAVPPAPRGAVPAAFPAEAAQALLPEAEAAQALLPVAGAVQAE